MEAFSSIFFYLKQLIFFWHLAIVNVGLQEAKFEIFDFVLFGHILMINVPSNNESLNLKGQFSSQVSVHFRGKFKLTKVISEFWGYHCSLHIVKFFIMSLFFLCLRLQNSLIFYPLIHFLDTYHEILCEGSISRNQGHFLQVTTHEKGLLRSHFR